MQSRRATARWAREDPRLRRFGHPTTASGRALTELTVQVPPSVELFVISCGFDAPSRASRSASLRHPPAIAASHHM